MHSPGQTEMVQQHANGELRLKFGALVDGQGHQPFAQNLMGELG